MANQLSAPDIGYGNSYIDALVGGNFKWGNGPVTYAFGPAGQSVDGSTTLGWTEPEKAMFRSVFESYAAVCGITFAELDYSADVNLAEWKMAVVFGDPKFLGVHYIPEGDARPGPLFGEFATPMTQWPITPGSLGNTTAIHEIGHALGLAHPHDGGWGSHPTVFPGLNSRQFDPVYGQYGLNQGIWTVMSYQHGWRNERSAAPTDYGNVLTPMAFDVATLQALYGTNTSYRTGNDTYQLPTANTIGTGWSCIWDAGGSDTISNAGSAQACSINLLAAPLTGENAGGYVSWIPGVTGGFTVANGVLIENAVGGNGNDNIVGNKANNYLLGGAGNDSLTGGLGNDTIIGGDGRDTVYFSAARAAYTVRNQDGIYTISGSDGVEQVSGVEFFAFSDRTLSEANLMGYAPNGRVIISGFLAQGQLLSASHNLVDYDGLGVISWQWLRSGNAIAGATALRYKLTQADVGQTISVQATYIDGINSAESVTSAATAAINNVNDAPSGSVTINGIALQDQTLSASHNLSDADGVGLVSYQWRANGININGANTASFTLTAAQIGATISVTASYLDGYNTRESVASAPTEVVRVSAFTMTSENYAGTNYVDWVIGTNGNDSINGWGANDTLNGEKGQDSLCGSSGNDLLNGGDGNDLILQDYGRDSDTIVGGAGIDTIDYSMTILGSSWNSAFNSGLTVSLDTGTTKKYINGTLIGIDTHSGIEGIVATNGNDNVTGSAGANVLGGGAGNDTLNGAAGDDTLSGGDGRDVLSGGSGNDYLEGQAGDDMLYVGAGNNTINGGAGNDTLGDVSGSNTYVFDPNFGRDTITNWRATFDHKDSNVVQFNDINASKLLFQREGYDLKITVAGTSDLLKIFQWYRTPHDENGLKHFQIDQFQAGEMILQGQVVSNLVTLIGAAPVSMANLIADSSASV